MSNSRGVDAFESMENRILRSLPLDQFNRLRSRLEPLHLRFGVTLYEAGCPITQLYFPNSGLVSLLASTEEGQVVEVAIAGIDGMVGIPIALERDTMPYRAIVQVEGTAFKLAASVLREELVR